MRLTADLFEGNHPLRALWCLGLGDPLRSYIQIPMHTHYELSTTCYPLLTSRCHRLFAIRAAFPQFSIACNVPVLARTHCSHCFPYADRPSAECSNCCHSKKRRRIWCKILLRLGLRRTCPQNYLQSGSVPSIDGSWQTVHDMGDDHDGQSRYDSPSASSVRTSHQTTIASEQPVVPATLRVFRKAETARRLISALLQQRHAQIMEGAGISDGLLMTWRVEQTIDGRIYMTLLRVMRLPCTLRGTHSTLTIP